MKTQAKGLSSKKKAKPQKTLVDRDAAGDVQGAEARARFRGVVHTVFQAPYQAVRDLEEREKGKSGKGRKRVRP